MKNGILLFIESSADDDSLAFDGGYLPNSLPEKLSSIGDCFFSVPQTYSGDIIKKKCFVRKNTDDISFWKEIFSQTGSDNIIKIFCDSPFLDVSLISDMLNTHTEYIAEFTYSENIPSGLSCEIISKDLLEGVSVDASQDISLSQIVRSNINRFDVELFYREPDIRDKRLSFRSSSARDKRVMENLVKLAGGIPPYASLEKLLNEHPEALYAAPSYIEIELTDDCELSCIFCPREVFGGKRSYMDASVFASVMEGMKDFTLPYTICLGGLGEPLMHKEAVAFISAALENAQLERLVVETNGLYIDEAYRALAASPNGKKLITIVNINGCDRETYIALHGADKFSLIAENIDALFSAIGGDPERLYVQIMKINETEAFLDRYYDFWEEKKIPVILQKQNTYLGRLQDRRYSDLTPLERTPCWHLQRDMFVLADGTVAFCKQDAAGAHSAGNILQQSLAKIYESRISDYIDNWNCKYPSSPDCSSCDEWYTFNF
ncbi:MAG: spiro-SPASM protein [Leptospirales bacterium]|nr:spiro-SPASM protein [Leptospirales bacterium]